MKKSTIIPFSIILLLVFSSIIQAQSYLPKSIEKEITYKDFEKSFYNFAQNTQLQNQKGWKSYSRWLNEKARQANPDGSFGHQNNLFSAATRLSKIKQNNASNFFRNNTWTPEGPNTYAENREPGLVLGLGRINTISFHPTDPNTFWVGVAQGGVWKTTNGGESYTPLTDNLPIIRVSDIAVDPNNPDVLYLSVGDIAYIGFSLQLNDRKRHTHYGLGVYKTTDGGLNWSPTGLSFQTNNQDNSLIRRVLINPENTQELVAAGFQGIWKSTDGGDNWNKVRNSLTWDIDQHPTKANVLFATTGFSVSHGFGNAAIWKSTDFGTTWNQLTVNIPSQQTVQRIELDISLANPDYIYALVCKANGGFFGLFRSTDEGENWELRSNTPNILGWTNGSDMGGQGNYDLTMLADPTDPEKIYIGGVNIWGSTDGGINWEGISNWVGFGGLSIHGDQQYIDYNPIDKKFYACNDGGFSRTSEMVFGDWQTAINDQNYRWPTQWEDMAKDMQITSFYRLGLSKSIPGDVIAGAQDNSNFYKRNGVWEIFNIGDGHEGIIHPNDPDLVYAALQFGFLTKSTEGGANSIDASAGISGKWSTEFPAWSSPFFFHPNDPNTLYMGWSNVYKTQNGGGNWRKISSFPGAPISISAMAQSASNPTTIYVARRIFHSINTPGELWVTFDDGANWNNITGKVPSSLFFTYLEAAANDSQTAWVTLGGFVNGQKIYRTKNGGQNWENISYNLPNVPVNCVRQDAQSLNNTIYVGTDIGIYYINDEITEWQLFSDGLPNVVISELEIQKEERRLYASTFGRGIWSTPLFDQITVTKNVAFQEMKASISPNPTRGEINLKLENNTFDQLQLQLIDVTGKILNQQKLDLHKEKIWEHKFEWNIPSGLYFLRLSDGEASKAVKFLVAH